MPQGAVWDAQTAPQETKSDFSFPHIECAQCEFTMFTGPGRGPRRAPLKPSKRRFGQPGLSRTKRVSKCTGTRLAAADFKLTFP